MTNPRDDAIDDRLSPFSKVLAELEKTYVKLLTSALVLVLNGIAICAIFPLRTWVVATTLSVILLAAGLHRLARQALGAKALLINLSALALLTSGAAISVLWPLVGDRSILYVGLTSGSNPLGTRIAPIGPQASSLKVAVLADPVRKLVAPLILAALGHRPPWCGD